jgi:hypothetical protein
VHSRSRALACGVLRHLAAGGALAGVPESKRGARALPRSGDGERAPARDTSRRPPCRSRAAGWLLRPVRDDGDLDEHPAHELRADRRSHRAGLGEARCVDAVEPREVIEVGEMHEARDDVVDPAALLLEQRSDVADRLFGLLLDQVARERAVLGETALTGEEDEAVGAARR